MSVQQFYNFQKQWGFCVDFMKNSHVLILKILRIILEDFYNFI